MLLLIEKTLNRFYYAKIYIKLDIITTFNYLCIREEDKLLTIFCIWFVLFKYVIIPFRLYNRLVLFQHYISNILQKYFNNFCTTYLNDILIFNKVKLEHKLHIKKVWDKLWVACLQVNIIKLQFHVFKIVYFGLIISIRDIWIDLVKVNIIIHWPTFRNLKDIQSFLRFANFYI